MELKTIVSRVKPTETFGFNGNFFVNGDEESLSLPNTEDPAQKRRGRPPGKMKKLESGVEFVSVDDDDEQEKNVAYKKTYEVTTGMLTNSIRQIDGLNAQIQTDISLVRNNKFIKNKYPYICELTGATTGLMGTKISAIRELNSVISKCHDLEMKRAKEFGNNEKENDDKKIMDMYNAFINTPVGSVQGSPFAGITPMLINSPPSTMGMVGIDIDSDIRAISGNPGYDNYVQNMTPEQNAMVLETNPFIKPVVIYNQETQDKYFDVVDTSTGLSVPNVPRPADFLLREMRVDVRSGVARNASANMDFPVILIGNRALDEY
jgi:hypothetical protein